MTTNLFVFCCRIDFSDAEKIGCSGNKDSDTIIDGFDPNEIFQNEYWEENEYLCHLLAIVIMTITVLLFV